MSLFHAKPKAERLSHSAKALQLGHGDLAFRPSLKARCSLLCRISPAGLCPSLKTESDLEGTNVQRGFFQCCTLCAPRRWLRGSPQQDGPFLFPCQLFSDVAYKARNRDDLIAGIDEFLDEVIVLPPGEWDPNIRIEPPKKVPSADKRCVCGWRGGEGGWASKGVRSLSMAFVVSIDRFMLFLLLVSFYFLKKKTKKQALCCM